MLSMQGYRAWVNFVNIVFNPVGSVKTTLSDEEIKRESPENLEARIEIFPEYAEGLGGIEGFSHLLIFFGLHQVSEKQRALLKARPRRLVKHGLSLEELPLVGVFCLDSPHRPNPIGLSVVRLLSREGRVLRVKGLDAFDGTPVIDIKPYSPSRRVEKIGLPSWYEDLLAKLKERRVTISDF